MSLDLGTLVGYLDLDEKKFDTVLDGMPGKLKGSGVVMGLAAGVMAAGVGAAISGGVEAGLDLQDANAKMTAELGLTAEESARIGASAGKLYADAYGESVGDVSNAITSVVSSIDGMRNASSEAVEATTAKLFNLQTAFEIDVGRSAQVAGQMIKAGLAKDPTEAIDLLTANLQRVPAALREDLLDAVDEYGPVLADLGFSGEEAFGMLANAADKGMYGIDKTGDALKEFTINLGTDLAKSTPLLESLGMNVTDTMARVAAGGPDARAAMNEIVQGILGIQDPAARAAAAVEAFGTPIEDLGVNEIPQFLDNLLQVQDGFKSTAGSADEMGETLNGTARVSWEEMSRTWDGIIGQVGGDLLPVLQTITDWLNANPEAMKIIAAVIGVLTLAFIGLTVATWAMNTALLANPITWLVLAIVALIAAVALLIMNWDAVMAGIAEAWAGLMGKFEGGGQQIIDWWVGLWATVGQWLTEAWANISGGVSEAWAGLMEKFAVGGQQIIDWWTGLWATVGTWLGEAWANITAAIDVALAFILDIFLNWTLVGLLIQYWDEIVAGATGAWNGLMAFLGGIPAWILGIFLGVGTWLLNIGRDLVGGMRTGITNAWSGLMGFLQSIPGTIGGVFAGAGQWLWDAGKNIVQGLLNGVKSLAGTVGSFFLGLLPSWIVAPFKAALGIRSPSRVFAGFGRNIAQGIVVGLDDEQSALDARVSRLVTVPQASGAELLLRAAEGRSGAAESTRSVDASSHLTVMGNVGWMPKEVEDERRKRQRNAAALAGIDELVVVA